ALRSVNILSVQVHPTAAGAVDDFLVDAPDALSEADLLAAVVKGRGRDPWVRRGDAEDLRDAPASLINPATRLVKGADLRAALAAPPSAVAGAVPAGRGCARALPARATRSGSAARRRRPG